MDLAVEAGTTFGLNLTYERIRLGSFRHAPGRRGMHVAEIGSFKRAFCAPRPSTVVRLARVLDIASARRLGEIA